MTTGTELRSHPIVVGVAVDDVPLARVARVLGTESRAVFLRRLLSPRERRAGGPAETDVGGVATVIASKEAAYKSASGLVGRQGWHAVEVDLTIAEGDVTAPLRTLLAAARALIDVIASTYLRLSVSSLDRSITAGAIDGTIVALAIAYDP